jgi:hypothetical protein
MKGLQRIQKKKNVEFGDVGQSMQNQLAFHIISGSQDSYLTNMFKSSVPLQQHSTDENFLDQTGNAWLLQQSKRPWQNWVRSLGQMWGTMYNPTHGSRDHTLHPLLTRQSKGMKNLDPGEKQQKALPVSVYRELHKVANASNLPLDCMVARLQTLAYSWCMRNWEFSDVQGERRTKILCIRNTRFFDRQNRDISSNLDLISTASTVSITFEFQKKEVCNDTISHQRSGDSIGNGEMCPVRAASEIIKRIYSYNISPEKVTDTPINYLEIDGKGFSIPSSLILMKIRQAVSSLGACSSGLLC